MEQELPPQLGEPPSTSAPKNQAEGITEIQDRARLDSFKAQFVSCVLSWLTGYYFSVKGFSELLANINLSAFATHAFNKVALPQDAQKALDEQQIATHPLFKSILQNMIQPFLKRAIARLDGDEIYAAMSFFALACICIRLSEARNPQALTQFKNKLRPRLPSLHPDIHQLYQLAQDELSKAPEPRSAALDSTNEHATIGELIELSREAKRAQQWEEALRIERQILQRDPDNVNARVNIAWLLGKHLRKQNEALQVLEEADTAAQRLGICDGKVYHRLLELQTRIKTSIESSTIPADPLANSGEQGYTNAAPPPAENAPADAEGAEEANLPPPRPVEDQSKTVSAAGPDLPPPAHAEEQIEAVSAAGPDLPLPPPLTEDQPATTTDEKPTRNLATLSRRRDRRHADPSAVRNPLPEPPASPEPPPEKPSNIDVSQFDRFVETLLREAKTWPLDARGEPWHLVPTVDQEILKTAVEAFELRLPFIMDRKTYGPFWKTFDNMRKQLRQNEINIKTVETMIQRLPNGIDWSRR